MRFIKHRLTYMITAMDILLAAGVTPECSMPKRRREEDYRKLDSPTEMVLTNTNQSTMPSTTDKNIQTIEEITRHLKNNKITTLRNDMPIMSAIKEHLKKVNEEQDGDGVEKLSEILSDFNNGYQAMYLISKESKLDFIRDKLFDMLFNMSPYSYPNSIFLYVLIYYHKPHLTADSIRTRFKTGFLSLLPKDKIIHVLIALVRRELNLSPADRRELIGTVFGQIDFSLEVEYERKEVIEIITAILKSDVPECFEEVFLTWKMWDVFTCEEQVKILVECYFKLNQNDRKKYKRETLVMLYLFLFNRNNPNSEMCKLFKKEIIESYGQTIFFRRGGRLEHVIAGPSFSESILMDILSTFDSCLLDLPNISITMDSYVLSNFRDFTQKRFYNFNYPDYNNKRYKTHVCYVLSKFTRKNLFKMNNGEDFLKNLYFDFKLFSNGLRLWAEPMNSKSIDGDGNAVVTTFDARTKDEINLKNTIGAFRQIVQSKEYNAEVFLKLLETIDTSIVANRAYTTLLFLVTKKEILKESIKTSLQYEHEANPNEHKHEILKCTQYIKDAFLYNACPDFKKFQLLHSSLYVRRFNSFLVRLINGKNTISRERYLFQRVIFHPEFVLYKNKRIKNYIKGLKDAHLLDDGNLYRQFVRDLILSDYYYDSAISNIRGFAFDFQDLKTARIVYGPKNDDIYSQLNKYREIEKETIHRPILQEE